MKRTHENPKQLRDSCLDHNLTLVAHMKFKKRIESNRLARQSLGMFKICKDHILLSYSCGRRKKKKKEDEQH